MITRPHKRPEIAADRVRQLMAHDPPNADNAERGLLSCVLQSSDCLAVAQDLIPSPEVFHKPAHIAVWEAVIKIAGKGGAVHLSAVEAALSGRGMLDQVGGVDYLIDLIDRTEARPSVGMAQSMAAAVLDHYAKRQVITLGQRMIIDGHETTDDASTLLERIQAEAMAAGEMMSGSCGSTGGATMAELVNSEPAETVGARLMTGLYDLDAMVKLRTGQLVVIGARPSMGKTSFLTAMADGMGRAGHPSTIHSLEMGRYEMRDRMLAGRSRVPTDRFEGLLPGSCGALNLKDARAALAKLPIEINDAPGLSLMRLRSMTRQAVLARGVQAVYIDYLQLLTLDKADSREQGIAAMSRGLKMLAREFNVCVILLSQLNRQTENREGNRPKMSDLRESGAIEQDADVVMLPHRPDYYAVQKDRTHVPDGIAEIIVAKQRNGPTGVVRLHFDAETASMGNAARDRDEDQGGLY